MSCLVASSAQAATLNVPGDHATIQACIDAAVSGVDECVVAPGTYHELIDFLGKALTLRSSGGPKVTIIDAGPVADPGTGKPVVRCDTGEGADTVLDGFTLTGGTGDTATFPGSSFGGGMFNFSSSPAVKNCAFVGNSVFGFAGRGAGMSNETNSSPTVNRCTFSGNSASRWGGGMSNRNGSNPTVTDCTFEGNSATETGGGMNNVFDSDPTVTDCVFSENFAGSTGGGMFNLLDSNPTVSNCAFSQNSAGSVAGGMFNGSLSGPTVANCTFTGNSAGSVGGGMFNNTSSPAVTNCTFDGNVAENGGGGMINRNDSSPTVTNCTFRDNVSGNGGGMYNLELSNPTVTNCTFTGNTADNGGGIFNENSSPAVINCAFIGNIAIDSGGAMHNWDGSNPILTDCTFGKNRARYGGGISNRYPSHPTLTNCKFTGNEAFALGGGMFCGFGDPTLVNCIFVGNKAILGGGMYNDNSTVELTNCTFTNNVAERGGGGLVNLQSISTATNCIVWDNSPNEMEDGNPVVSFSNVQGGLPTGTIDGGGNIDADPKFVRAPSPGPDGEWDGVDDDYGDLRLQAGSPCIDTGSAALLPADVGDVDGDGNTAEPLPIDLDFHPRVLCGEVDMGAYEFGIGDYDCNDVVNLNDFGGWPTCETGPSGGPYPAGCEGLDFDGDGLITLHDFAGMLSVIEGG